MKLQSRSSSIHSCSRTFLKLIVAPCRSCGASGAVETGGGSGVDRGTAASIHAPPGQAGVRGAGRGRCHECSGGRGQGESTHRTGPQPHPSQRPAPRRAAPRRRAPHPVLLQAERVQRLSGELSTLPGTGCDIPVPECSDQPHKPDAANA